MANTITNTAYVPVSYSRTVEPLPETIGANNTRSLNRVTTCDEYLVVLNKGTAANPYAEQVIVRSVRDLKVNYYA